MSVRRKGRGWEVRFSHAGRAVSQVVRGTRTDAQRTERTLRTGFERSPTGFSAHTIEDALIRWLEGEARALRSYKNLKDKAKQLLPYAGELLEHAGDVAERIKRAGMDAKLAPATINRRLAVLRRVARLAYDDWKWLEKPVKVRLLPGETPRYVQATADQVRTLMAKCEDPRVRDALQLAVLTGLRQGELLGLTAANVHKDRIVLDARTKTGRPRSIPLAPDAVAIAARLPLGLDYPDLRKGFEAAREAADMPWLQWRDLRRTFGSWIVQSTGSLKAAQDLLGHTSMQITARHYAHLLDEHLEEAVAGLPELGPKGGRAGPKLGKIGKTNAGKTRKKAA